MRLLDPDSSKISLPRQDFNCWHILSLNAAIELYEAPKMTPIGCDYTVSIVPVDSPAPTDAVEKKHHLKDGKVGFANPWSSWQPLEPEKVKNHLKGLVGAID